MFTGLSAVATHDVEMDEPFSSRTRSGQLMREIGNDLSTVECYYTNLVKCLPLRSGKIRYPTLQELEACFSNYQLELKKLAPRKVVLLGKQVSDFVAKKLGLSFSAYARGEFEFPVARTSKTDYLFAYHPSYVLVYRRRGLDQYKSSIISFVISDRDEPSQGSRRSSAYITRKVHHE